MHKILLTLLLSLPFIPLRAAEPGAEIAAMSFNIRYGSAKDGDNAWPLRRELVAETIARVNPDLLGLQESLEFQVEFLAEKLPAYDVYSVPREPGGGESCAIFFRSETFERTSEGTFWLSESPEKPGSKSWDSSLPRIVSWILLKNKSTGKPLLFANTHFDHQGAEARAKSAELIRTRLPEIAADKDIPIILTGDFNTPESSAPHKTLTEGENSLTDTYRATHPESEPEKEGTFNGFTPKSGTSRIDWILTSKNLRTITATIDRQTGKDGRIPSDHHPVTATLSLK